MSNIKDILCTEKNVILQVSSEDLKAFAQEILIEAKSIAMIQAEAAAVADFGIEHLACGERLVALYEFKDVVGQGVVAAPRHIGKRVIDDDRHYVGVLLEHLAAIHLERL